MSPDLPPGCGCAGPWVIAGLFVLAIGGLLAGSGGLFLLCFLALIGIGVYYFVIIYRNL
jgi:hypothetical protein